MARFQVTLHGHFWMTTEAREKLAYNYDESVRNYNMENSARSDAEYQIRKLFTLEASQRDVEFAWMWESSRWRELLITLISRLPAVSHLEVRDLVNHLDNLGLLNISDVARMSEDRRKRTSDKHGKQVLDFLEEFGVVGDEAERALDIVFEAATALQTNWGGKIQLYLRHYGELMLNETREHFHFTSLQESEVQEAFTYWLQNVLNMPLSMLNADVRLFCDEAGLTPTQLFEAADRLDLNLAILDDLVEKYLARRKVRINNDSQRVNQPRASTA
jgi:hypothetical protein